MTDNISSKGMVVLRMLARRDGSSWEALPASRGFSVFLGQAFAPEWASHRIEVVFAHVRTNRTPHQLSSAIMSVWQFDERGMIDDRHAMTEILRKLDASPIDWREQATPQMSPSDLKEICALLQVLPPD